MTAHHRQHRDSPEDSEQDARFNDHLDAALAEAQRKLVIWKRLAGITTTIFFLDCVAVVPFLAGHPMHKHWDQIGQYLVMFAMALLSPWLFCCGTAFNFWYYVRGNRRIERM